MEPSRMDPVMWTGQRDHRSILIVAPILRKGWDRSNGDSKGQDAKADYDCETHRLPFSGSRGRHFRLPRVV
jgi:hypothetical protein